VRCSFFLGYVGQGQIEAKPQWRSVTRQAIKTTQRIRESNGNSHAIGMNRTKFTTRGFQFNVRASKHGQSNTLAPGGVVMIYGALHSVFTDSTVTTLRVRPVLALLPVASSMVNSRPRLNSDAIFSLWNHHPSDSR
jgi:hypothetical protein